MTDTYEICETFVAEIGDKALNQLRDFISEANSGNLIRFCKDLLEVVNDEYGYRNQMIADEEARMGHS